MIVIARNRRDRVSLKTLSLLAVLPIVREFAYVYGMFLGFCKGRVGSIMPSWKDRANHRDAESTEKNGNLTNVGANGRTFILTLQWITYEKKITKKLSYRDAGVDIDTKGQFTTDIYSKMRTTFSPRVIENPDGFGGLFALNSHLKKYSQPVLVSSTDGVGTKLKIAFMTGKHDTIGIDLVAMCVNDIIVLGAEPLFLLDYLASSKIVPKVLHEVLDGIVEGCRQAGCALIGGETPEMPGFYHEGEYDIAGFVVGAVEKDKIIDGKTIKPGDVVIGLSSSGIHSNGFSLCERLSLIRQR